MHIVQILLPLADNQGRPFPETLLRGMRDELVARFGGLTAYGRAPAQGIWAHDGASQKDDIVVVEVMVERLDENFWQSFRFRLEGLLAQEKLIVRAFPIQVL